MFSLILLSIVPALGSGVSKTLNSLEEKEGAIYWIVVPENLRKEIEPLAKHRAKEGLSVAVAPFELFSAKGSPENGAEKLRSFFREGNKNWKERPRFLLLAGPAGKAGIPAFHKDWSKEGVEALDSLDGSHYSDVASDFPYADPDGDGLPDLAVGRFPAR